MGKIRLEVELEYDDSVCNDKVKEDQKWVHEQILTGDMSGLTLRSHHLGDDVGKIRVLRLFDNGALENINQLADAICGDRRASFEQMMNRIRELHDAERLLHISDSAMERASGIKKATDELLDQIKQMERGGP